MSTRALSAAGTLTLSDAVRLVRVRADAMQSAVPVGQGGMAAILGLDDDTVLQVCQAASTVDDRFVEAVNFGECTGSGGCREVTRKRLLIASVC
ncbi:hypothetical protein OURE66S_02105 [Oligella ureolytica]